MAAALELHARAGVAAATVLSLAARSGGAGAATRATPVAWGSQGPLGPPPAPGCPRPERPGSPRPYLACARVTGNDAHTPRLRWGCWPTGPRWDEGGAGAAEDGQVERGCAARLYFLCTTGNPREGSWLYGSTPEPTCNRTDQIA